RPRLYGRTGAPAVRPYHRRGRAGVPSLCGRDPAVREGVRAAPLTGRLAMRIMANENVPGPVVAALRSAGHDVAWGKETLPEAKDREVLARAGGGSAPRRDVRQGPRRARGTKP